MWITACPIFISSSLYMTSFFLLLVPSLLLIPMNCGALRQWTISVPPLHAFFFFFRRTSETPTTTISRKSIAIHLPFLYHNTPPICIAVLLVPLGSKEREVPSVLLPFVLQYASHLYRSTLGKILVVVVAGMFPKNGTKIWCSFFVFFLFPSNLLHFAKNGTKKLLFLWNRPKM